MTRRQLLRHSAWFGAAVAPTVAGGLDVHGYRDIPTVGPAFLPQSGAFLRSPC
jgi:hypothetical protein